MDQHPEYQYLNLLKDILENGAVKHEFNTGIEFKSVFGRQMRFDLARGFPLLTTKKVFWKGVLYELLWFLKGDSNIKYLVDNNIHIWDDWAYRIYKEHHERETLPFLTQNDFIQKIKDDKDFANRWGELLTTYGRMWRRWPASDGREIDQIAWAIEKLKKSPDRRHCIVSAWNPDFIYEMASPGNARPIPPFCHTMFQFNVLDGKLSCHLYQRSADMFLGVPFNIASYALLTALIAHITGYEPGEFIHTLGDAHIYGNHYEQVMEQLSRTPKPFPIVAINPAKKDINTFSFDDFTLEGYSPWPPIKGEVTVVGGF